MHFFFNGGALKKKPILDQLSFGTGYAYSLRKMTKSATNAIRVRRSVDNYELDIGFVGNDLDITSLLSFVGEENLLLFSEQFENAEWIKSDVSVLSNTNETTDPLGNNFADKLSPTSNDSQIFQPYKVTNGETYTFSIWLKSAIGSDVNVDLTIYDSIDNIRVATKPITVTNIWNKFEITYTSTSENITRFIVGSFGSLIIGENIYAWGAQLNTGLTSKPYNKTTFAIGGDGFVTTWYNQFGGVVNPTQAIAGNQPRIVSGTVLYIEGDKPSVEWQNAGTTDTGLLASGTHGTSQALSVFSMKATTSNNARVNSTSIISASTGALVGSTVSAIGALNGNNLVDFNTIPVTQTATITPLQIINFQTSLFNSPIILGNINSFPRSWYGGISETLFFSTTLSDTDREKLLKDQAKYYGITL